MWYAQRPERASRQVAGDLSVAAWTVAWIVVGTWLGGVVRSLAEPVRALAETGASSEAAMQEAGRRAGEIPVVGDRLGELFTSLGSPGAQTHAAATRLAERIDLLGTIIGVVAAAVPTLVLVVPWLVVRVAFSRRAAATRRLVLAGAGPDLFALRALSHASVTRLAAIDPDPAGAWRRADPAVIGALADLELAAAGLRSPTPSGAGGDGRGPGVAAPTR